MTLQKTQETKPDLMNRFEKWKKNKTGTEASTGQPQADFGPYHFTCHKSFALKPKDQKPKETSKDKDKMMKPEETSKDKDKMMKPEETSKD
jgi:hypothetical protein